MIVYGDPCFDTSLHRFSRTLRERLMGGNTGRQPDVDQARGALIHAGQLEQALCDLHAGGDPRDRALAHIQRAAELTATALVRACDGDTQTRHLLCRAGGEVEAILAGPDQPLRVKVPEGFAFYALFPEQYAAAALRWAADHGAVKPGPVLVLGVRSIGTALSAVVTAALREAGWEVRRETIRPTGHPYAREAQLTEQQIGCCRCALVVDEGPGRSGSSMAAAAQALVTAGIAPERIAFLPGHGGEPGPAASGAVRHWWGSTPRYVVPLLEVRWRGRSLWERLAVQTERLTGIPGWVEPEELGWGLWRRHSYGEPAHWPAACAPFEAPKYRFSTPPGEPVVWKFAGLAVVEPDGATGAEVAGDRLRSRYEEGWTAPPVGTTCGFVALPWISGEPLTVADASPKVLAHVGRYLAAVAVPGEGDASGASGERLAEMLYWNTHQSLGPEAAERTRRLPVPEVSLSARYGDGRLAPHEWLRGRDGRLYKTDAAGHEVDHTVVGTQSVLWDLAGALIEWKLNDRTAAPLCEAASTGGVRWEPAALQFYRMAYAAFRLGQCRMCLDAAAPDPEEQARLHHAASGYQEQLAALLDGEFQR